MCVGGDREGEWVGGGQNLKQREGGLGNIREVFLKMEGGVLGPLCQLCFMFVFISLLIAFQNLLFRKTYLVS